MATKKKDPLEGITAKPAPTDANGMTALDRVIAQNQTANASGPASFKTKEEAMAARSNKNAMEKGVGKVTVDPATGKSTGFKFPDGSTKFGLTQSEIAFLSRKYGNQTNVPVTSALSPAEQSSINPLINPEELSSVGQAPDARQELLNTNPLLDPLTADIASNQEKAEMIKYNDRGVRQLNVVDLMGLAPVQAKKLANIIGGTNVELKSLLEGYSNEDNYNKVLANIAIADTNIQAAIVTASNPEHAREARIAYDEAQNAKRKALAQLTLLSRDQKAYVSNVRIELTKLQQYFDSQQKVEDDLAMQVALQQANIAATMVR